MLELVALVWVVYLSECLVKVSPGEWLFRETTSGRFRAADRADVMLLGGRVGFSWAGFWPWSRAFVAAGSRLTLEEARACLASTDRPLARVRAAAGVLFFLLPVVLTSLVVSERLLPFLFPWIAATVLSWGACIVFTVRALRVLHGGRVPSERWLPIALSPLGATRAPLPISTTLTRDLHAAALAAAIADDGECLRVARQCWFDQPSERPAIEALMSARGLGGALHARPRPDEPTLTQYCPRCFGLYTARAHACADCEEVALKAIR